MCQITLDIYEMCIKIKWITNYFILQNNIILILHILIIILYFLFFLTLQPEYYFDVW